MAKIWIDLDNTPHVPLFKPLVRELDRRGHAVVLTARNAFQVCELATRSGMKYTQIGKHYGKNSVMKVWGLGWRSVELFPFVRRERPGIGLSHGSRSQILLCNALRIPSVMMADYEHVQMPIFVRPRWEIVPAALSGTRLHATRENRILRYQGIKEDIYVPEFTPDAALRDRLGLQGASVVVTVRPPANEAHYHNPEAELLFAECVKRVCATPGAKAVLLPRNRNQEAQIRREWPEWFSEGKVVIPSEAVDGLNLLWYSDIAVSGGGTMNREAAALGVPVYSVFRGKLGAVDRRLNEEGKLVLIEDMHDVETRFVVRPRDRANERSQRLNRGVLSEILDHIDRIVEQEGV
ncbi:MAG: DUF354 domain-containing protein [Aromatoleum sp.]|jgi:predicted glycosyltransferase|uniref:DUF354 domain-containing protein n=1 Tax=Aromatoleum sp. TaxID=2307007 RepID=UPI002895CA17|nr:DUF354 domain-containing protein [Aromatoleum sp.]MDT3669331.1 DUF354 domain-containing protein [Aromatoleum sp.]